MDTGNFRSSENSAVHLKRHKINRYSKKIFQFIFLNNLFGTKEYADESSFPRRGND